MRPGLPRMRAQPVLESRSVSIKTILNEITAFTLKTTVYPSLPLSLVLSLLIKSLYPKGI